MISRFQDYLVALFKEIPPSREAMEYREDMLSLLLDKEQELKIKGVTDDELIFNTCIASLGDAKQKVQDFNTKMVLDKRNVTKRVLIISTIITIPLLVVFAYLTLSFATKRWDKTWLLLVGAAFLTASVVLTIISITNKTKFKFWLMRSTAASIIALAFTYVFLIIHLLFESAKFTWIIFLVLVMTIVVVDTLIAFITKSKTGFYQLPIATNAFVALLYVILGATHLASWHPTWLMILAANIVLVFVYAIIYALKKKNSTKDDSIENPDEYYTQWRKR